MIRRLLIALFVLFAVGAVALAVVGLPLADIRPDSVQLGPDAEAEQKGRALLDRMLEAHGGQPALHRHRELSFSMRDTWFGMGTLFNPWPDNDQRITMRTTIHSFDSQVHFENGPRADQTWGIDDFEVYQLREGERVPAEDADLRFMLPTTHYFLEMPQRLTEAELVRYVGQETVHGTTYDVVYATWGSIEANGAYDQYRIYLDPQTGRLAKTWYTVREIAPFVTGIAHMLDVQQVDGYALPHRIAVTPGLHDDPEADALHVMMLSNVQFVD